MKAIVCTQYGPPEVLEMRDVDKPTPRGDEVLIKTRATTVTAADGMMRRGDTLLSRIILGLRRPKERYRIMGIEIAGEVEQVGRRATRFKKGDRVFGFAGFSSGTYAQYKALPEDGSLAIIPDHLGFEEAAAVVDGATTAWFFLHEKGQIQTGDEVLIIGASGSVGTSAVQLASQAGARVTAVCSGGNTDLVKSLGADEVVDYTREDFTSNGKSYDIIFDTVGKSSFFRCRKSLAEGGRYLVTVSGLSACFLTLWTRVFSGKKCIFGMSVHKDEELRTIKGLLESRAFRPVIDRRYTLEQMVDAHRYVDKGHKKGNVVVTVAH
jgi:NADPH:quinone reductase-like Zn-dependent oxidoreductase